MRALLLTVVVVGEACAAAPPARMTPEQAGLHGQGAAAFRRAHVEWKAGNRDQAIASAKESLALVRRVTGEHSWTAFAVLDWLANWEGRGGRWKEAAAHYERMWRIQAALWGGSHWKADDARWLARTAGLRAGWTGEQNREWDRGMARGEEAVGLWKKGRSAEAIAPAREALDIVRRLAGEKHPVTATTLFNLGAQHGAAGEYAQALSRYREALTLREQVSGVWHPDYAKVLNNLALLHAKLGDRKAALACGRQALDIRYRALGARHPDTAQGLNNLALVYSTFGDHRSALPLYRRAVDIDRETLGEKHPSYATSINGLAVVYKDMGDYRAALPLFRQSLEIIKGALGERHPRYASGLNNLASLYKAIGDLKGALPLVKKALELTRAVLGEKHPAYAADLANLAGLLTELGDTEAALPLARKALALTREALGEKHGDYAARLHTLAGVHKARGELKAAVALFDQILAIYKDRPGEEPTHYVNNLAFLHHRLGDHKAALPLYRRALEITERDWGERHPDYATRLNNLASLHLDMGDAEAALPLAEKAVLLSLDSLRAGAAFLSDRQQLVLGDDLRHRLDFRLSLLDSGGYAHALAWKGTVLLGQRQRRLFTALAADPKTRGAADDLQAATRLLAALHASGRPDRERVRKATEEQERSQAELARLSAEARAAFEEKPPTPAALAAALPEGTVLVDYLFYRRFGLKGGDGRPDVKRHLVAFVTRAGRPSARFDLGPGEEVEEAVRRWRPYLAGDKAGESSGAELKRLVWSPLEKHLVGAKTVLVSPDGVLASVPFAALPGKKEGAYLIEDVAIAAVPVPRTLPEMLRPPDKASRLKPSLLVLGGVDYDKAATPGAGLSFVRGAPPGVRRAWAGLPGTAAEAAAVAKSFAGRFEGGGVTSLGKSKAGKSEVREALASVRYAHLATHGFFAPEAVKSAHGVEPDDFFGREGVPGWHPLLLSGVALAGANKDPAPGEEDGILTALEVSEMTLPRLELVVLSACETGLGRAAGGEGLLGMQRAFQIAGARTVVASLWKVDDAATMQLMSDFYSIAWDSRGAVSRAEALRKAQLAMLFSKTLDGKPRGVGKTPEKLPAGARGRTHPYYWAAFILSGDWR